MIPHDDPSPPGLLDGAGSASVPPEALARLARGDCAWLVLGGRQRRASVALALARTAYARVLVVAADPDAMRRLARADGYWRSRLLALPPVVEAAELELRLSEVAAGVYAAVVVDPERVWQARVVATLTRWQPTLLVIDAALLGVGAFEHAVEIVELVRRVRHLWDSVPVLLLTHPGAGAMRPDPARELGGGPLPAEPWPAVVSLRAHQVTGEGERLALVSAAITRQAKPALIIASSRGKATALAAGLSRLGHTGAAFHAGLSASERAAVLGSYRAGRLGLLVATAAVLTEDLPLPGLLACSHPPRSLFELARLAEIADGAAHEVPLLVLHSAVEASGRGSGATAGLPSLARLRVLFGLLRRAQVGRSVLADPAALEQALGDAGAAQAGVIQTMLDVLAYAGYLRRHENLPRAATVTVAPAGLDALPWLQLPGRPRIGVPAPFEPLALARALALEPDELQRRLLEADAGGSVIYRAIGQDRHYSFLSPLRAAAAALAELLQDAASEALAAARLVARLLAANGCRRQMFAALLGLPEGLPCGRCDRCRPVRPDEDAPREDWLLALIALAAVPLDMPPRTVFRVVRTALEAAGRAADRQTVERIVDQLLARGALVRRDGSLGDLLVVGHEGSALLSRRM